MSEPAVETREAGPPRPKPAAQQKAVGPKEIRKLAEENPEAAAQMVKMWLREGDETG